MSRATYKRVALPFYINTFSFGLILIYKTSSGKLSLKSEFEVKLVDHKIQVPELVFQKIAEVITVKLEGEYKLQ